jgi:hypothetical protein
VETDWAERVGVAASPYGLKLVPEKGLYELFDPRNEAAIVAQVTPALERLGIRPIAVNELPTQPMQIIVDGVTWDVAPMDLESKSYRVPSSVFIRTKEAEAAGISFGWFLWGEEQFAQPRFEPVARLARSEPVARMVRSDTFAPLRRAVRRPHWGKLVLGVAAACGVAALIPLLLVVGKALVAAITAIVITAGEIAVGLAIGALVLGAVDPILIGVIPTGPNRGLWCVLGTWYHTNAIESNAKIAQR